MLGLSLIVGLVTVASLPEPAQAAALGAVVSGIPLWVYALLALLVWLGLQARRTREVGLARLLATPAAFILWGLASLLQHPPGWLLVDWGAAAIAGALLALATLRSEGVAIDPVGNRVTLPGSWLPLARNLAIFAAKFALGFAAARNPAARDQLALWDIAISGASAGYFIGWVAWLATLYRRARQELPQ